MQVKVIAIDDQDRVKLSRKQAMRELGQSPPAAARGPRGQRQWPGRAPSPRVRSPEPVVGKWEFRMTNDECRRNDEARMTKWAMNIRASSFVMH